MERKKKERVVEELRGKLERANSFFLSDYSGLNVAQMTRIRRELRGVGAELNVVKNSLFRIAAREKFGDKLDHLLLGTNAMISVYRDPVQVAKVITAFTKEMPQLRIKGGFLGARFVSPEEFQKLSTLPSREALIGSLLGLFHGMPVRLVYALKYNIIRLIWLLNAIKEKKENTEGG